MSKNKLLTDQDLAAYWENFTGLSDDGCDVSDADSLEDCSFIPESDFDDENHDQSEVTLEVEEVNQQSDDDDDPMMMTKRH